MAENCHIPDLLYVLHGYLQRVKRLLHSMTGGRIPARGGEKPFLFRGGNGNHRIRKNSLCYIRIKKAKSSDNPLKN